MSEISICTAFYDIGRGYWSPDKGHPHYLQRSVDTYMERFGHLAKLENDMTIFTSHDLVDRVWSYRKGKEDRTNVVGYDASHIHRQMLLEIQEIQKSPEFIAKLNPHQKKNPEYWSPEYVLVTSLKSYFAQRAATSYSKHEMIAWIDFGYCRSGMNIPENCKWEFDFDPKRIHLFNYKEYDGKPIEQIVMDNDVYILGAKVVASRQLWTGLEILMINAFYELISKNLVDDDQGQWLMAYLKKPELFELHRIPDHQLGYDPFVLFNQFNTAA